MREYLYEQRATQAHIHPHYLFFLSYTQDLRVARCEMESTGIFVAGLWIKNPRESPQSWGRHVPANRVPRTEYVSLQIRAPWT